MGGNFADNQDGFAPGKRSLGEGGSAQQAQQQSQGGDSSWLVLSCLLFREIKEEEGQLRVAGDRQREEDVSLGIKLFMIIDFLSGSQKF